MIYIFLTILFSIQLYLYYFKSNIDYIDNINDGLHILKNNFDYYYNTLSVSNMKEKTRYNKHINNYRNFATHILPLTLQDKNNLEQLVLNIENMYLHQYNNFCKNLEWNFVCMDNNVEHGMPHTIDKYIIIPNHKIMSLNPDSTSDQILFIHEQLHIFQRKFQDICNQFYIQYMGFIKPKKIIFDKVSKQLNFPNPDGLDIEWCYKLSDGRIICPLFIKKNHFQKVGLELEYTGNNTYKTVVKNKNPILTPLKNIHEYQQKFNTSSNYHPNEITADMVSEYMVENISVPPYIKQFINTLLK